MTCLTEIPPSFTITPTENSITKIIVLTFYPIDPTIKQKLTYNCTLNGSETVTCKVDIKPFASGDYILTHAVSAEGDYLAVTSDIIMTIEFSPLSNEKQE